MHIYLEKPVDFKKLNVILEYSRQMLNTSEILDRFYVNLLELYNKPMNYNTISEDSAPQEPLQNRRWSFFQSNKVAPI